MKITIVSDAWFPQVNGVVRTLSTTAERLGGLGHEVDVIGPNRGFRTVAAPTYPEIQLAIGRVRRRLTRLIDDFAPDAIHVATEGPLGWAARAYCRKRNLPFTTSFHTFFPDYLYLRFRIPRSWTFAVMRRFHRSAARTMISTPTMQRILEEWRFANLVRWPRGVDTDLFALRERDVLDPIARPILMFVGRVAVEKNIEAFLNLDVPGTKVVVGDGPMLATCRKRYPDVVFTGVKKGEDLARHYAAADAFVFPSRTETFGLVMLEALASGVPVAAYPVQGPQDIVTSPEVGALDEDLGRAVQSALGKDPAVCRNHALQWSWDASVRSFAGFLAPVA